MGFLLNRSHSTGFNETFPNFTSWYLNGTSNQTVEVQSIHLIRLLSALPYILIILSISTVFANTLVLAAFIKNPLLRTPFNCYLVSLIISDIGQAGLDLPFTILSQFQPVWPLGRTACNFNLYAKWVFVGIVRNTHALISLNRIWALVWPVEYKQYHTRRTAAGFCFGTWVYVHVFLMPGMIPDALYYRPEDGTCAVATGAQPIWATTTQFMLYNSTIVVIAVTYPFIWWKIRHRQKKTGALVRPGGMSTTLAQTSVMRPKVQNTCVERSIESSSHVEDHQPRKARLHMDESNLSALEKELKPRSSQSFAVLTYLVIGVIFCWSPVMIFFTMEDMTGYNNNLHFAIGSLLYYFNSLLDPFFFCTAIRPLRVTVLSFFRCSRGCRRLYGA